MRQGQRLAPVTLAHVQRYKGVGVTRHDPQPLSLLTARTPDGARAGGVAPSLDSGTNGPALRLDAARLPSHCSGTGYPAHNERETTRGGQ